MTARIDKAPSADQAAINNVAAGPSVLTGGGLPVKEEPPGKGGEKRGPGVAESNDAHAPTHIDLNLLLTFQPSESTYPSAIW